MRTDILVLAVFAGSAVFINVLLIAVFYYNGVLRSKRLITGRRDQAENDWLFGGFHDGVYRIFLHEKEPSGVIFGLDIEKYERQCEVLHIRPEAKTFVAMRIEGALALVLCIVLGSMAGSVMIEWAAGFLIIGFGAFFLLYMYPSSRIDREAVQRLEQISDDLPRFVILLEKAMVLPIEQAILITAKKFHSPLSDDLVASSNEAALGAQGGWQKMLVDLAKRYNIQEFSSLVLDITNAYNNGNNIRDAIRRKGKELEESQMYTIEERDSKVKTLVFIPVIIFKLVPITALLTIPMIQTVM